jgi:ion channel
MAGSNVATLLLIIFLSFFVAILIFALIYSRLYTSNATHFSFNSEILLQQKQVVERSSREELSNITKNLVLMTELVTATALRRVTILFESAPNDVVLPDGRRYEFRMGSEGPHAPPSCWVTVYDEQGRTLSWLHVSAIPDGSLERLADIAKSKVSELGRHVGRLEERIASIPTGEPDVWNFIDFLYFSTIIQTTVGLGDILPNSRTVRLLVVVQVMLGYGILVVALNIVLNNH